MRFKGLGQGDPSPTRANTSSTRAHGWMPRWMPKSVIDGLCDDDIVRVGAARYFLQPVSDQELVLQRHYRWQVRPIDEHRDAGHDGMCGLPLAITQD